MSKMQKQILNSGEENREINDAIILVNHLMFIGGNIDKLRSVQAHLLETYRRERNIRTNKFYQVALFIYKRPKA